MAPQTVGVLNQDRADVDAVGVRGTPTFFVNGKPLYPFGADELRALVAAEVAASGSLTKNDQEHTYEKIYLHCPCIQYSGRFAHSLPCGFGRYCGRRRVVARLYRHQ